MAALARWCFRRRAWVLIGWLAVLVILGVTGRANSCLPAQYAPPLSPFSSRPRGSEPGGGGTEW